LKVELAQMKQVNIQLEKGGEKTKELKQVGCSDFVLDVS
jgi:hypothetical protein